MTEEQTELNSQQIPHRNPYTVWFVVLSFVAPVVMAYVMFYFVDVTAFTNRGEIFTPVIDATKLELMDKSGKAIPSEEITYKWRVYTFLDTSCDQACTDRLHEIRQMHATLGKDRHRLYQAVIHLAPPDESLEALLEKEHPDIMRMYGNGPTITRIIANDAKLLENEIYFQDPMGNIMMRFTQDQPIQDVRYDLRKLLKASQIG